MRVIEFLGRFELVISYQELWVRYQELRIKVFCCALTSGQAAANGLPARPPLCEAWAGGFYLLWSVVVSRHSLNKFRNCLSPLPKYSLQIIQSLVLLFQIVNLETNYRLVTKGFCVWAFSCFYFGRAGSTALMKKLYMHKSHAPRLESDGVLTIFPQKHP